jgi:hypothetical protein
VGAGDQVGEQQRDAVDGAGDEPAVGSAPAVEVLEAGYEWALVRLAPRAGGGLGAPFSQPSEKRFVERAEGVVARCGQVLVAGDQQPAGAARSSCRRALAGSSVRWHDHRGDGQQAAADTVGFGCGADTSVGSRPDAGHAHGDPVRGRRPREDGGEHGCRSEQAAGDDDRSLVPHGTKIARGLESGLTPA